MTYQIEPTDDKFRHILGTFPKVTIDPRVEITESRDRGHQDDDRVPPRIQEVDQERNALAGFIAAERIFRRLQKASLYIEAIKVSFEWRHYRSGPCIWAQVHLTISGDVRKVSIDSWHPFAFVKDDRPLDHRPSTKSAGDSYLHSQMFEIRA